MNFLPKDKRILILKCLVEGMCLRSAARIADVSRNTVVKLLADAGKTCCEYQDEALRNLPCKRIQCDEIWSFVYAKAKNVPRARAAPPEAGDVWTWTAMCADTKLVPSWRLGDRSAATARDLMDDLQGRLANRIQLTTDGHRAYLVAVEEAFGADVDYAMLVKLYGKPEGNDRSAEVRYSPSECVGTRTAVITGKPNEGHISTSYMERQNLTMRMSMRRFTRLTNAFSRRLEFLGYSVALHFMHYNFCRIHQTLRITPAMAAGVTDRLWEIGDIVELVERATPMPNRPKSYRKKISN